MQTTTPDSVQNSENEKAHPWRRCPIGQHFVKEHTIHIKPSKKHPDGLVKVIHEHCENNPSHKEELSYSEIQYITETYFDTLYGPPTPDVLTDEFKTADDFDEMIRGWTKYWNDIFNLDDPLDANLVKALMGSESSFQKDPTGTKNAHGLMQLRHDTFCILQDTKGELHDYMIRIPWNKILDPTSNICMGVRWLFQKKKLASIRLQRTASWEEAVIEYKSYWKEVNAGKIPKGLATFRRLNETLQGE